MKRINSAIFLIAILFLTGISASAQETEQKVVDEVVAQVNDNVITLSRIRREMEEIVNNFVQEGKSPEEARSTVAGKRGELIAGIINEELLLQKVKEYSFESEVESELNRQLLEQMNQLELKTLDDLYKEMEKSGVDPTVFKEIRRKQISKDIILQNDVDRKVYNGWSKSELKKYYEANKDNFKKPETVTISEIFLNFAGRDEAVLRDKASKIVAQARGGTDFIKLAIENSDRPNVSETKGAAGIFKVRELDERFAKPLEGVKIGGVTDPINIDNVGLEILRVDARSQASGESVFDEPAVRSAMTYEVLADKRKEYLAKLRADSYIKINENYRAEVEPILSQETVKTTDVQSSKKN